MARAQSPFTLRGKVDNLIFQVRDGKQRVYAAPFIPKDRHQRLMVGRRQYALNIHEFALASTTALEIYRTLAPQYGDDLGRILRPYTQNRLTALLKRSADHHTKAQTHVGVYRATAMRVTDVAHALTGLDIGLGEAVAACITMTPLGPRHNPTAVKIKGLAQAAEAIHAHGNAQLELRLHVRQAAFSERHFDPTTQEWIVANPRTDAEPDSYTSRPTDWIPTQILPPDGLTIDLPRDAHGNAVVAGPHASAVYIEWRLVHTVGRKVQRLHQHGVARIVAVHGKPEDFLPPAGAARQGHHIQPPRSFSGPASPAPHWQQDPVAYIKNALGKLRPT